MIRVHWIVPREVVNTSVGMFVVQSRYSIGSMNPKTTRKRPTAAIQSSQTLKMPKVLAIKHLMKENSIVLNFQIGDEMSFPAKPHKVKKSQPDFSNTPFEKNSGWLVLSSVDPELRENWKPYGHDECGLAESMFAHSPCAIIALRKRGLILYSTHVNLEPYSK